MMKRSRQIVVVFLLIVNLNGVISLADETEMSPGMKSLLFPGLGQYSNNEKTKGVVFMLLESSVLSYAAYQGISGSQAYDDYLKSKTPEQAMKFRDRTCGYDRRRDIAVISGLVIWSVNIIDIYYNRSENNPLQNKTDEPDKKFIPNLFVRPNMHGIEFGVGFVL